MCLFWLMARLDFLRFHRNRCVSNGSDGLHRTTFQPSSKYCLHFRFHLMTKLPVTQVDSLYFPSGFIFRLDSVGLLVLSTGIWSRVLDMSVTRTIKLNPLLKWLLSSNLSQFYRYSSYQVCKNLCGAGSSVSKGNERTNLKFQFLYISSQMTIYLLANKIS